MQTPAEVALRLLILADNLIQIGTCLAVQQA
jgi:hypothetical protein